MTGAMFALTFLLVWLAARRRKNLARWTLLILFILTLPLLLFQTVDYYVEHPSGTILDLAVIGCEALGLALAFSGDAKAWFREGPPPLGSDEAGDIFG